MSTGDVMGLRFRTGGNIEPLVSNDDINNAVDQFAGDVGTARVRGHEDRELVMFIDAQRDATQAINPAATQLRGDGWPIVGDAVLIDVDERPLPRPLLDRYTDPDPETDLQPVEAIEWDDRLDELDRGNLNDIDGGLDSDVEWDDSVRDTQPDAALSAEDDRLHDAIEIDDAGIDL